MSLDLWISVAVAIPLSILANMITPRIQRYFDARVSASRARKSKQAQRRRSEQLASLRKELALVETFRSDPSKLINWNFIALFQISLVIGFGSFYGIMVSMIPGLFHAMEVFPKNDGALDTMQLLAQIVAVTVALLLFRISSRALKVNRRVNDYDIYKAQTDKLIEELAADGHQP